MAKKTINRPVAARILLRLKAPDQSIGALDFLHRTLQEARLVRAQPQALRWSTEDPAVLELICTFVDRRAARTWMKDPRVLKAHGDDLKRLLRGRPRTVQERDFWIEADDDRVCPCDTSPWFMLQGPPRGRDECFWCGECGLAVPQHRMADAGVASWADSYRQLYSLWLESGLYESWAERELSNVGSELNTEGRRLAREVQRAAGVPVYYDAFSAEIEPHPTCRNCDRPTTPGPFPGWVRCRRCRLAYCES